MTVEERAQLEREDAQRWTTTATDAELKRHPVQEPMACELCSSERAEELPGHGITRRLCERCADREGLI